MGTRIIGRKSGAIRVARLKPHLPVRKYFFPPRCEAFDIGIHCGGTFGSEGVQARIFARLSMLRGLKFKWIPDGVQRSVPKNLQALLDTVLTVRIAWLRNHGIEPNLERLRAEVVTSPPSFIFDELLCNAFDAHARANRRGTVSLYAYTSTDGAVVVDVSDNGIGIKSVHQSVGSLNVNSHDVKRGSIPFVEGELGIGLTWSRFVAELHGGTLEFLRDMYPRQTTTVRASFLPDSIKVCFEELRRSQEISPQPDS